MITIAFFNNKGGVGKTSLVYHSSWMYAELGYRVIAADLDPQSNLSSMFLTTERLEELWPDGKHPQTLQGVVEPITRGLGDIAEPHVEPVRAGLGLLVGDFWLSKFESNLSAAWPECNEGDEGAFRTTSALFRMMKRAAKREFSDLVLIDVGPNLGAINRAALIAADFVVIPLAPDLFSLQGLRNLGPQLATWRGSWAEKAAKCPDRELELPSGTMTPAGYLVMQHSERVNRPVKAYRRWMDRIPAEYRRYVLEQEEPDVPPVEQDPHCLATIRHYRSLMPLAMEARKPMFELTPADGAIGAHIEAVGDCRRNFRDLAVRIASACHIATPART